MKFFTFLSSGRQTTIKNSFVLTGQSICKNKKVVIKCLPAKPETGLIFYLKNQPIKVNYENFRKSSRHTTILGFKKRKIFTVEHVLSAFYGLGIDNAIIKITGDNQLPLMDGSSWSYAENILSAGIKYFNQPRKIIKVIKPYVIKSKLNGGLAFFLPAKKFSVQAIIDFKNLIGIQNYIFSGTDLRYYQNISQARTFFIEHFSRDCWQKLQQKIKSLPSDPHQSNILVYNKKNFISKLRYQNEPVRHKILDFLGDFSLLGHQFLGQIIIYRPGHFFNYQIVRQISKMIKF